MNKVKAVMCTPRVGEKMEDKLLLLSRQFQNHSSNVFALVWGISFKTVFIHLTTTQEFSCMTGRNRLL